MALDSIEKLAQSIDIRFRASGATRFLLGITGPPGAGKSTVSKLLHDVLCDGLGRKSTVVPMDGYHLSNDELVRLNLRSLKGIPSTFDAEGFVKLISDIKCGADRAIAYPIFDRDNDCVLEAGGVVEPSLEIIIIEGNYLLMTTPPWHQIRYYLDEVYYIDAPHAVLLERLLERHIQGGMNPEQARMKVDSTDFPNAELIETTRPLATKIVKLEGNGWRVEA